MLLPCLSQNVPDQSFLRWRVCECNRKTRCVNVGVDNNILQKYSLWCNYPISIPSFFGEIYVIRKDKRHFTGKI